MLLHRPSPLGYQLVDEMTAAPVRTNEQLGRLYLEVARMFVAYGKSRFARRRLKFVIDQCGDSAAARESRLLLDTLDAQPLPVPAPSSGR